MLNILLRQGRIRQRIQTEINHFKYIYIYIIIIFIFTAQKKWRIIKRNTINFDPKIMRYELIATKIIDNRVILKQQQHHKIYQMMGTKKCCLLKLVDENIGNPFNNIWNQSNIHKLNFINVKHT